MATIPPGPALLALLNLGANLILGHSRLDPPDQVFAIIMGETKVRFRRQLGPFEVADRRCVQIARLVNALELHCPFHREHPPAGMPRTIFVLSLSTPNFVPVSIETEIDSCCCNAAASLLGACLAPFSFYGARTPLLKGVEERVVPGGIPIRKY